MSNIIELILRMLTFSKSQQMNILKEEHEWAKVYVLYVFVGGSQQLGKIQKINFLSSHYNFFLNLH